MRARRNSLLEVTLLFVLVIGICRVLFYLRSIPFISQTLPLWAAGMFLYLPVVLLLVRRKSPQAWGLTLDGWLSSLGTALLVSLVVLPGFLVLFHFYQTTWLHQEPSAIRLSSGWFLLFLYHLLCVSFPEEVFYRGYMQSRLNEAFPCRVRVFFAPLGFGWLYTAVLFALGHFLIDFRPDTLATFFPGLAFGWLRERTGSILASVLFHALCNGTILLLA